MRTKTTTPKLVPNRIKKPISKKKRLEAMKRSGTIAAGLILIVFLLTFTVTYDKGSHEGTALSVNSKTNQIISKISGKITLPTDAPTIFEINYSDQLAAKNQFFANAKDGNTLVYYPNQKKGIIYDEPQDKIIYVGDLDLNQSYR